MSKAMYEKFLKGERLTYKQAIKAQCYVCNGMGEGGGKDCKGKSCPLYQFMPSNPQKRTSRILTPEQRQKAIERGNKLAELSKQQVVG